MLDEFYIEELVKKKFPLKSASFPTGIGDDAAVFKIKSDKIVFSCDSQVEGVHFDLRFLTPEQLAFRALSVNILVKYSAISFGSCEGQTRPTL